MRADCEERESEVAAIVVYDGLAKEYKKDVADQTEWDRINSSFIDKRKQLVSLQEKMNPNMKAVDHLSEVTQRLEKLNTELQAARDESSSAAQEFKQCQKERRERFMGAYTHLAEKIDAIYKDLTRSPRFPHGGQANLSIENLEEPYLAGVKFHAMPPNKRFRDMEQLSGGEKTLAALALLFAVHSYQPSPFFVLDEIDDALDAENVNTVAQYIRARKVDLQVQMSMQPMHRSARCSGAHASTRLVLLCSTIHLRLFNIHTHSTAHCMNLTCPPFARRALSSR